MVMTTAVLRGRRLNKLKRALPTRVPRRSPTVAITPPKIKIDAIKMYPVVIFSFSLPLQIQPTTF